MLKVLIIDLEATCADDGSIAPHDMEIIEVGACWISRDHAVIDQWQAFVRPIVRSRLTTFCTRLTTISQADVDGAETWPTVAMRLREFIDDRAEADSVWASWGEYDLKQIQRDCQRHHIRSPLDGLPHINLKAKFADTQRVPPCGMDAALRFIGLPLFGTHHRALDDALNISRLLPRCVPSSTEK